MQTELSTLFNDLMALCDAPESSFYFTEPVYDGKQYRVFTYRLASFTEFQQKNASECRGHTFRLDGDTWVLASLPMAKFWNYGEHIGWGNDIDLDSIDMIMDKADGSLISTVSDGDGNYFLKSKTSFTSSQAVDAAKLVEADVYLRDKLDYLVDTGCTVNMEYVSPSNQIVIGYNEPALIVLNVRLNSTGEYMPYDMLVDTFGDRVIKTIQVPTDTSTFIVDTEALTGIEGYVVKLKSGLTFKLKTEAYCILHHLKDSINNPKRLWEACISETTDDLRALFKDDPISVARITEMEAKASKIYNHVDVVLNKFYNENKDLDRKSYAIKGQAELVKDGIFSLAMNLYIGRDSNIKEFLIKNYKSYGVSDEVAIISE